MSLFFRRRVEDFVCEHCGQRVTGSGYTNHCPNCLWSKHVDVFPGDRIATCHGLMEPIGLNWKQGQYQIVHRCQRCGQQKTNRTVPADQITAWLENLVQ